MRGKDKKKEIIGTLDPEQKKLVAAQVRSVRIQSVIAILIVIGSAISFVVIQQNNIKGLWEKRPIVHIHTREAFVKEFGVVTVTDMAGKKMAEADLKNLNSGIELSPGSYNFYLKADTHNIWKSALVIQQNEVYNIDLPEFYTRSIRIFIRNNNSIQRPGQQIDLDIISSGNGYLWIYEQTEQESKKLFPAVANDVNQITAGEIFRFPDGVSLVAGKRYVTEKYVFIVTSVNDEEYAREIMDVLFRPDIITKGEVVKLEKNWGVEFLSIPVIR